MDEKHRFILSMYYRNPDNHPERIPDWCCSMGMDITQLLLLTKAVFKEDVYKFKSIDQGIGIVPIEEKRSEYTALIYENDEQLCSAEIIDIMPALKNDNTFYDACLQEGVSIETRTISYQLIMLVNNINGTHKVSDRDSIEEFCIFADHGKFFVEYLYFLLKSIIVCGFLKKTCSAEDIIYYINSDYFLIAGIYSQCERILNQIYARAIGMKNYDCMEDEALQLEYWINDKMKVQGEEMFKFLFHDAMALGREAAVLIRQIVDILDVLSDGNGKDVIWRGEAEWLYERRCPLGFKNLCDMVLELRKGYRNYNFQKQEWAYKYLGELELVSKQRGA